MAYYVLCNEKGVYFTKTLNIFNFRMNDSDTTFFDMIICFHFFVSQFPSMELPDLGNINFFDIFRQIVEVEHSKIRNLSLKS